jgi:uncharacterized protein (DUF427 family)
MTSEHRGQIRIQDSPKRVRIYLGGEVVADSRNMKLVWEVPYYPTYYFPINDVGKDVLVPTGEREHSPSRGEAHVFDVHGGAKAAGTAARRFPDSPMEDLRDLVRFDWDAMDAWFEEDEEVYTHARDPHTRIDILASSRHVRVDINGVTVAESHQPRMLFETGLPTRYYLPQTDLRMDLLRPSDRVTHCPYKGSANYWSVEAGGELVTDVVWVYRMPLPECAKIAGLAAFYNERVDLIVDAEPQPRPQTKFSDQRPRS